MSSTRAGASPAPTIIDPGRSTCRTEQAGIGDQRPQGFRRLGDVPLPISPFERLRSRGLRFWGLHDTPAMRRDALESKITTPASSQGSSMNDTTLTDAVRRVRALSLWRGPVAPGRLEGGPRNQNFLVPRAPDSYVVRLVAGDDPAHGIVRDREVAVSRAAHRAGFAAELVLVDPGVLVFRF